MSILLFPFFPDFLAIFILVTIFGNVHRPYQQYPNNVNDSHSVLVHSKDRSGVRGGLSSAPPIPAGIRSFRWNSGGFRWNGIWQKALLI